MRHRCNKFGDELLPVVRSAIHSSPDWGSRSAVLPASVSARATHCGAPLDAFRTRCRATAPRCDPEWPSRTRALATDAAESSAVSEKGKSRDVLLSDLIAALPDHVWLALPDNILDQISTYLNVLHKTSGAVSPWGSRVFAGSYEKRPFPMT